MYKRAFGAAALAGSAALFLSACGSSSPASSTNTTSSTTTGTSTGGTAAQPTAPATLSTKDPSRDASADLVIWADNDRAPVIQKYATEFGAANGVNVAVQVSTDVRKDFSAATQTGNGPDVIVGAHDWLGEFVQNNSVEPLNLSADVTSQLQESAVAATKFNGQVYGVPYAIENVGLVRNTALAPTAPATMDDLVKQGDALVKSGKAKNALLLQIGKTGNAYYTYPFMKACGGGIFGTTSTGDYDPKKVIVDSAESLKGAAVLGDLGKQKILSTNVDGSNADGLFTSGKAAYYITGPWSIDAAKKANIKYAISPLPSLPGCEKMQPFLGVQMFYVSSKAKNKAIAEEFVTNYMTREDVQLALFEVGHRPPALKSAYDKVAAQDPDVKAWYEAGAGAAPMPNIPAMNAVWGPLGQAGADVIAGKSSPATAFGAAQKAIVAAIAKG